MPKQQEIDISGPGIDRLKIKEVEQAANAYVEARDKRMALTEIEVARKIGLIQTVLGYADQLPVSEDGSRRYHYDDLVVILRPGKPNVKVKTEHADTGEEDNDEIEEG